MNDLSRVRDAGAGAAGGSVRVRNAASLVVLVLSLLAASPQSAAAGTELDRSACLAATAATTIPGGVLPGATDTTGVCSLGFGSSDSTAVLHMFQADGIGAAMHGFPTGALDASFGTSGVVRTNVNAGNDEPDGDVLIQPDGKILVAGSTSKATKDFAIVRYLPSGALDTTFGSAGTGKVSIDIPTSTQASGVDDWGQGGLALQPDGKILFAGHADNASDTETDFAMVRLLPNGTLDPTFSGDGKTTVDIGGNDWSGSPPLLQPDGKIIQVGNSVMTTWDISAVRYLPGGTLDTTFGTDGKVTIDIAGADDRGHGGSALQPGGKILIGGRTAAADGGDFAVVRLHGSGSRDNAFGTSGVATADINDADDGTGRLAVQTDGRILQSGTSATGMVKDAAVVRYLTTGAIDTPSFGVNGRAVVDLGAADDTVSRSLTLQQDGRILVAGTTTTTDTDVAVMRLKASGTIDARFGTDGVSKVSRAGADSAHTTAMGPDGTLYVASQGYTDATDLNDFYIARFSSPAVADYGVDGSSFASTTTSVFGACLQSASGATAEWTAGACPASDAATWRAVPAKQGTGSRVATAASGTISASANLRFGLHAHEGQNPGMYAAPLIVQVLAPDLLSPQPGSTAPAITGTLTVGQTLSVSNGSWTGTGPLRYTYTWQRCDSGGANCATIEGYTESTYVLTSSDAGSTMKAKVTAVNSEGQATAAAATTAHVAGGSGAAKTFQWLAGFEGGTASTAGGGNLDTGSNGDWYAQVTTEQPRHGAYSYKASTTVSDTQCNGHKFYGGTTTKFAVSRIALYVPALPAGTITVYRSTTTSTARRYFSINLSSAGQLSATISGSGISSATTTIRPGAIETGRWYVLEMKADASTLTHRLDWRVDGVAYGQATATSADSNLNMDHVEWGICTAAITTFFFDDAAVSSTSADYPLGNGKVLGYRLSGDGTHATATRFQDDDGTAIDSLSWQKLAESPFTGADWVNQVTADTAAYLEFHFQDQASTEKLVPRGARLMHGYHSSATDTASTGQGSARLMRADNTEVDTAGRASASTGVRFRDIRPSMSLTDTATLNGLKVRMGYASDVTPVPYWDSAILEAEYELPTPPANSALPTLSPTSALAPGTLLDGTRGTWTGAANLAYTYQWLKCDTAGVGCAAIPGATDTSYIVTAGEVGSTLRFRVTASNAGGIASAESNQTATTGAAGVLPENSVAPTLTGRPVSGQTLAVVRGEWLHNPSIPFAYAWLRCNAVGEACVPTGATGATYSPVAGDVGYTFRARETATNAAGSAAVRSGPTPVIRVASPDLHWVTGFEAGTIRNNQSGLASLVNSSRPVVVDDRIRRSGEYSAKMMSDGGGQAMTGFSLYKGGVTPEFPTSASTRAVFYFDDLPNASMPFFMFDMNASDVELRLEVDAAGALQARIYNWSTGTTHAIQLGITPIMQQRWHTIEMSANVSGTTWYFNWRIDGRDQPTVSWASGAAGNILQVAMGVIDGSRTSTLHLDDVVTSRTDASHPIGDGRVLAMRPESSGTHVAAGSFRTDSGAAITGTLASLLDETPLSSTEDFAKQVAGTGSDYLETLLSDIDAPFGASGVRAITSYHSSTATANDGAVKIARSTDTTAGSGATVYDGNMGSGATLSFRGEIIPPPAAGWTTSELAALMARVGFSTDLDPQPQWNAVLVEADLPQLIVEPEEGRAGGSPFTDTFSDTLLTPWNSAGGVSEPAGRMVLSCTGGWSNIWSDHDYNMHGASLQAEVPVTPPTGANTYQATLNAKRSARERIGIKKEGADLLFEIYESGQPNTTSIAYDATAHRWWRIRELLGTTYWETSPDNVTWTTRRSLATPLHVGPDMQLRFSCGHGGAEVDSTAEIDNLSFSQ